MPPKPGVYIMHDERDAIIYVGKAVNLHNRVRSYFRKIVGRGPQIDQMVKQIARFEYIVTDSELEALILENNLIKEHRPKYNTMRQIALFWPLFQRTGGEKHHRAPEPDVRAQGLRQSPAQRFREGTAMPEPPYGEMLCAVHGRDLAGGI